MHWDSDPILVLQFCNVSRMFDKIRNIRIFRATTILIFTTQISFREENWWRDISRKK